MRQVQPWCVLPLACCAGFGCVQGQRSLLGPVARPCLPPHLSTISPSHSYDGLLSSGLCADAIVPCSPALW